MLEPIMKGLIEWIYEMVVGIMEYAAKELVGVMSMDMAYFEQTAPVIKDITNIILALGWGMLIANMVFQSTKAMMSGVGFESEDPKHIFCRTFVFAFLLLASKQICNLAMGITGKVIELLQIPSALDFSIPDQSMFDISSSVKWLIVIVVGFILIFQYIKLLFEIGERYVVTSVLTFFSPLAFAWLNDGNDDYEYRVSEAYFIGNGQCNKRECTYMVGVCCCSYACGKKNRQSYR